MPFVEKMRELHRVGRYAEAFKVFVDASGAEAELARKVMLGYVSYALNRVGDGEVVREPRDVDRIMGFGFNWAPPTRARRRDRRAGRRSRRSRRRGCRSRRCSRAPSRRAPVPRAGRQHRPLLRRLNRFSQLAPARSRC